MTGLTYEQVLELGDWVEDYLGGWQPKRGRRREMELFDAVVATLFYYRHNCSQEVTGAVFGVSQSTISRMVNDLEEPIAAVLDCEVPELEDVITGRVIILDGTLIPTRNRAAHRELYSGKRHESGAAVQILSNTEGRLRHVGEPIAGSIHDVTAFRETGLAAVLADHMNENLVIADLGYLGEPVVTPVKKPPKGELSPAQIIANKHLSGIRSAVERCIAHLKNWKILATGYRRPLRKLVSCLTAVAALEFY
jgi:DDE superfamily endonuclease/Helix-turn-helix of DDE superfamily endonuclease